jgi:hypothetical protein
MGTICTAILLHASVANYMLVPFAVRITKKRTDNDETCNLYSLRFLLYEHNDKTSYIS